MILAFCLPKKGGHFDKSSLIRQWNSSDHEGYKHCLEVTICMPTQQQPRVSWMRFCNSCPRRQPQAETKKTIEKARAIHSSYDKRDGDDNHFAREPHVQPSRQPTPRGIDRRRESDGLVPTTQWAFNQPTALLFAWCWILQFSDIAVASIVLEIIADISSLFDDFIIPRPSFESSKKIRYSTVSGSCAMTDKLINLST